MGDTIWKAFRRWNSYGVRLEGCQYGLIYEYCQRWFVIQFNSKALQLMTSYIAGLNSIERERRRPAATSSGARQTRRVFGNAARKWLPIPEFIDMYNHFMKGVDTADQMRSYYTSLKIHRRTWKPLFHFLLDTTVTNFSQTGITNDIS